MSDEVTLALIGGVVTIIGALIAYFTKKLELKPTTRIKTSDVRDLESTRVVEGSSTLSSLQGYVEFLNGEMASMKDSINELNEARKRDAEQIELVTKANYWHRAYEQVLIEHINSGKAPPPPNKPVELEILYAKIGINVYEERAHNEVS